MKTTLRRFSSTAAIFAALIVAPLAFATPTITFTPGQFPQTGSPAGVVSTPAGLTISVTAAPTGGASIVSVQFAVNGTSIGAATGSSPFTINWAPSVAGAYTITATVNDTSAITTGANASTNTATINSIVTISAARAAMVVAPINNATLAQNSQIFLRSTAAMSDGVVQKVEFVLDPGPGETIIGTALQAPYNVPYLVTAGTGTHTLIARATASDGVTVFASATTNLNVVSAVGSRPTVALTAPAAGAYVATSAPVTLTATASDSDGFIPSSAGSGVTFFADGEPVGTDLTAPYSVSWTPTVAKVYSLVAQAVDDRGNIGQSAAVNVTAVATLPTVTVSAPSTGIVGTAINLTATATASPSATVTQVAFFLNGAPLGAAVTVPPYSVSWTPTLVGPNLITAQVTDSAGITATSSTSTVNVSAPSGTVVTLNAPANGATITQGSQLFLRTSAAIAGNIVGRVDYYLDGVLIPGASVSQTPYNIDHTFTAAVGPHTIFARAVASDGVTTVDSATAAINIVAAVGAAPTVTLTSPTTGSFVATGSTIVLSATATDSDGFISSAAGGGVTFYADGEPVGNDLAAPYVGTWTPATAKTYTLRAQTVDDKGNTVLSPPVTVTAVSALPTVALSSPPATGIVGTAVTLTATATASPAATVTQVAFFANGVAIGAPATVAPYTVSWTPSIAGANTLTAQVTDSAGITVVSAVANVSVAAQAPTVVVTAPVAGSVVTAGSNVILTANATPGASATVAQVQFLVGGSTIVGTDTTAPYSVVWTPAAAGNFNLTAKVVDSLGNTVTSSIVAVTAVSATSVSLTAPANNANATVGTPVTVNASAAPIAGATITQVAFFENGVAIGAPVLTAPFTIAWTPATAGTSVLTAQATDSFGTVATSSIINVNVANAAPTVALTSPAGGSVVTVGNAVSLTATATPGTSATITQVQFLSGSTILGTATAAPYTISWTPLAVGNVSLTAKVTDSNGATATSSAVSITVATTVPTIAITAPTNGASVALGAATTVTAAATATGGATVSRVDFLAGATAIGTALVAPYTVAWTPTASGIVALTAKVTDSNGTVVTSSVVNVLVTAPSVAITTPLTGSIATIGTAVPLTATASAVGAATVAKVEFFAGATLLNTVLTAPYTTSWIPTTTGAVSLTAKVTDSNGASVTSSAVSVTVNPSAAPTIAITSPATGTVVQTGTTVTVSATATPGASATVAQVQFFVNGSTIIGTTTTGVAGVYSIFWTPSAAGNFSVTARVLDSANSSVTSTAVTVTAVAATSVALTAPANNSTATVGTPVAVTASAAAVAGATITRVDFFDGATPIGTVNSAPFTIAWTPTVAGVSVLTAQATDSFGTVVTSSAVNVTVANAAPTVAITSPVGGQVVTVGSGVTLAATATPGTSATIVQVQFLSGVTLLGTATTAPYSIAWTPSATGSVSLTAKVTDSNGATATSAAVSVTVATSVPTISLTAPLNGANLSLGAATILTAAAAGTGGASVSRVDFLAGSTTIGTALAAPYSVSWTPTASGITALTARVTDSNGTVVTSTVVNVNVLGPTVALTSPTNATVLATNSSVTLTATAAAVAPATVSRVDFFAGSTLVGSSLTAPYTVSWTASPNGTVSLTARVVDSNGVTVTSTAVSVTVVASPPTVALTSPANGDAVGLGAVTTLTATASAAGSLTVARVDFLAGSTVVGTALVPPYSVTWTPTAAGIVALTARVTDSAGTAVTSPSVNVTVTTPTVAIISPLSGTRVSFATPTTLTALASAFGSATIVKVDFYVGSTFLDTGTPAGGGAYTVDWTPTSTGTQSITARVTDSNGAVVTSTAISVNVATVPPVVTLTSPTTGTALVVGTPVALTATATAGGGASVTRVDFLTNSSTIVGTTLVAVNGVYTVNWTPTAVSNALNISARVTDSNNAVDTSNFATVSVSSTTTLGVVLAITGGNATIPAGSSRYLTASVSGLAAIAQVEFYIDGELIGTDSMAPFNILFNAPTTLGAHILTARAIDGSGGVASSPNVPITIVGPIGNPPAVGLLSPVSGSFVAVNATTTITGIVTDSDGSISAVQVFANGVSIGNASVSGSTFSINWVPNTLGSVSLSAVATDNHGNATSAPPLGVFVAESNSPSISLAISPGSTTLPVGATRNIVATAAATTGRAVVRVEFFVDGTKVGEDTAAPYTFRYVAPALASGEPSHPYVISARATDNAGAARDAQLTVSVVSPVGAAPTVNLLTPANNATAVPGAAITLAATAISSGGTIASVQFYVNGSPTTNVTAAPYVSTYTIPTTPGTYTFDAIATDDRGNTAVSNSATITASFSVPTIVITAPNPNATARATPNVPLTLSANATVQTGAGASVLLVEFLLDGVQIAARTTASNPALGTYATTWIPTTAQIGAHVLTARVTDTNSQSATSSSVNVNVATAVGTPPTVTISTSPIPGSGLQTLSQVNFFANAFANGVNTSINNVEFFLNDVSIGLASREQTTNLYRLAYDFSRIDFAAAPANPNNPSQYILPLYAIARDSNNNQTVSTTSNLTINAATSAPPTITLTALTPTTVTQATQILLLPVFSDSDGTVAQIQLYANGTVVQSIGNPVSNQSLFTYTANTPGRFNLFAVATDDTGNTAIATPAIVIQVNAVNAPDTALTRPSSNSTTTTVGAPVFLEGTARATGTTSVPTLVFIATGSSGSRTQINGSRVGTTTTYRAIWTPNTADTYSLVTQATVAGVQNTSTASRTVVVNELIGLAPTVSISVPSTVTTASNVNFTATVSDSDGSVIDVEFFVNRNSIGKAVRDQLTNTWRLTASFAGLTPGSTEVVARATDSAGNVAASSTSFINLVAASSIAPSITVTPSTTNAAYNRQVQLRANARDNDGTVSSVQYFANGASLGSSTNSGTSYQVNWTPTVSGTFNVYAIATDNTSNTTISPTVQIDVRRNNPVLEDAAFILQTYQDISNTTTINPLVFDDLDTRLSAGTLARADLVVDLIDEPGFLPPIQLLAAYLVIMEQLPTPANYTTLLSTARNSLSNAVNSIISSNEYFAKYGVVPTTQLLDSPTSVLPAEVFLNRLHQSAGLPPPSALNRVQFRSYNLTTATQGRGYAVAGLPAALAEFVTNTNSTNTALFKRARAAALFYQLARPSVAMTVDEITAKVNALVLLPDDKAVAEAVLKDILYAYRYVTITKHPASLTLSPRSGALFNVEALGSPPLAYQWLLNGSPIAGATNAFLSLTNVSASNAGTYTVAITSSAATATSDPATLTLSNSPTRLANISTRGGTTSGSNVLIGGFVVSGTAGQTRQMLIRVVGPTLAGAPFNVTGTLANPALELYSGANRNPVLTNDDWGNQAAGAAQAAAIQQAAARAAAFALPVNSRDAAVLATLPPGLYTVMATVPAATPNASGVVLIEVYDVTQGGAAGPKAANVSTRGFVGTGTNSLIAGFVVNGAVSRRMLIRGAGPTLASLGVPGVLADPQITLVAQATGQILRTNDNWASGEDASVIAAASTAAGAFPLASSSRDAAMIIMLEPGAYTVQLSGVGNTTGVGIVEVYDVDP